MVEFVPTPQALQVVSRVEYRAEFSLACVEVLGMPLRSFSRMAFGFDDLHQPIPL
jgi:hypothetical protein